MEKDLEKPLVSIVILAYNGESVINDCLNSVLNQTHDNIEVIVVDNASIDKTSEIVFQYAESGSPPETRTHKIELIRNKNNIGFAGHNIGIKAAKGEFILCMNQDIVLNEKYIEEAVKCVRMDEGIGAVQGKLLRKQTDNSREIIDTTGQVIFKSRRMADRGMGEEDKGQYDKTEEVFGVNGALPFFRKRCLEDVAVDGEYYDPDFFMYKEDIDLSWRIRLYGWKVMFCPKAVAYVDRTSKAINEKSGAIVNVIKTRKKQSQFVKNLSFKNHRLAIIKNDLPWLFIKHLPWILPREIGAWMYVLIFEPKTWPAIGKLFRQAPGAWEKRKIVMKNKKAGAREMGEWFN